MATRRRLRTACVDRNCDPSLTVGEYLASWLELCEGRGLRPASIASYGVTIRTTIAPRLGRIQLESITPPDSDTWRPIHRSQRILRRLGLRDRGNFRRGTRSSFGNSSILCATIGSMRPSTLRLRQACAGVKCLDS